MTGCAVVIVVLFAGSLLYGLALLVAGISDRATRSRTADRSREDIVVWHERQDRRVACAAAQQAASDHLQLKLELLRDLDRQIALARETFHPPKPAATYLPPADYRAAAIPMPSSTAYLPSTYRTRDEAWEDEL